MTPQSARLPGSIAPVWTFAGPARLLWWSPDTPTRAVLIEILRTVGVEAIEAEPGQDVAGLFVAIRPDAVLLDWASAPDEARYACQRIRAARRDDWRPVLGVVSQDDEAAATAALAAGFDDLVWRPIGASGIRQRIAAALRQRQERQCLRLLTEGALAGPGGIAVLDLRPATGAVVSSASDAFETVTGFSAADVVGRPLPSLAAHGDAFHEGLHAAARGRKGRIRFQGRRRDGTAYAAEATLVPVSELPGHTSHVVVSVADVQDDVRRGLHEADETLPLGDRARDSAGARGPERRFTETLLDQITTCVVTVDASARVSFANRSALETLETEACECLGRSVIDFFDRNTELLAALRSVADGGERRLDFALKTRGGRALEVGMTVLRAGRDAPADMSFVLLFRDLANVRQFELELRRVERLSAIGNMVAGFAHEVRNPLGGIQALAEAMLAETAEGDGRREYASRILALLARIERFVKASLQFGEPSAPRKRSLLPTALVETALEALAPRWGRRGAPPAAQIETSLPPVEADESQLVESLLALLENALDAAGDPSRVRVRVWCERGTEAIAGADCIVRFDVHDEGPGIPDGQLSRIFDPFYTTKAKGTGLGLPMAQTLVRENGGRLLARSMPGDTVFSLLLPGRAP